MSIEIGVLLAVPGCLAALAGWSNMRRRRRLKMHGVAVWAMIVRLPEAGSERDGRGRTLLQYALEDGRVVERPAPGPAGGRTALEPGRKILIWYDPADPADVLVFGRYGRLSDWAFVSAGLALIAAGGVVAALGR